MSTREQLLAQLRAARTDRGLSQFLLAEITGLSQGRVSELENGRVRIGLDRLLRLADVLGYDLALIPREEA